MRRSLVAPETDVESEWTRSGFHCQRPLRLRRGARTSTTRRDAKTLWLAVVSHSHERRPKTTTVTDESRVIGHQSRLFGIQSCTIICSTYCIRVFIHIYEGNVHVGIRVNGQTDSFLLRISSKMTSDESFFTSHTPVLSSTSTIQYHIIQRSFVYTPPVARTAKAKRLLIFRRIFLSVYLLGTETDFDQ